MAALSAVKPVHASEEEVDLDKIITKTVAWSLETAIDKNTKFGQARLSMFCSTEATDMSLGKYVERFRKYSIPVDYLQQHAEGIELTSFAVATIGAIILLDRYQNITQRRFITLKNIHRLFLAAFVAANKMHNDCYFGNVHLAKIGGVSAKELGELETEFLFDIKFSTLISSEDFSKYLEGIKSSYQYIKTL